MRHKNDAVCQRHWSREKNRQSETGKKYVSEELGFIAPFDTFGEADAPTDPLSKEVSEWLAREDVYNIPWNFTVFPSQTFKDNFGSALLEYAQGTMEWDEVEGVVTEQWKTEKALLAD